QVDDSVSSENPHVKLALKDQLGAVSSALVNPFILMLIPRFLSHGLFISFMMNVYPTSLQYSTILATNYPMITAYYAFAMCAGTILSGLIIPPLNRAFYDFGLRPMYYVTAILQLIIYTIAALTVPNRSTAEPTSESSFFEPRLSWVIMVSILMGFADSSNTASSSVICSRLIPGRASHTYSAARLYRGVAASTIFLCSPILTMKMHSIILIFITV
ncbi:hypothetical protein PFISCL1PPCAC_11780, partial [Pristionchus fissidentatus]